MSTRDLVITYVAAVTTSVGVAMGLTKGAPRLPLSPALRRLVLLQVPFLAVALSNIVNVGLVRRNEMTEGIQVFDAEDRPQGASQIAGRHAAFKTAAVRIASSLPLMTLVCASLCSHSPCRFR